VFRGKPLRDYRIGGLQSWVKANEESGGKRFRPPLYLGSLASGAIALLILGNVCDFQRSLANTAEQGLE
jgi:hypothetical protein